MEKDFFEREVRGRRHLSKVKFGDTDSCEGNWSEVHRVRDYDEANAVISQDVTHPEIHHPVLDIDFPAQLIPSTRPGHYHLYLGLELTWPDYKKVLTVLAEVGILEKGFADASIAREASVVRLPWVKKETK